LMFSTTIIYNKAADQYIVVIATVRFRFAGKNRHEYLKRNRFI